MQAEHGAPIYKDDKHTPDFNAIRDLMGFQQIELAQFLDLSVGTLKNKDVSFKTRAKANPLTSMLENLWKLSQGNYDLAYTWLHSPKDFIFGLTPIQFMQEDPSDNIKLINDHIRRQIYGDAMGM